MTSLDTLDSALLAHRLRALVGEERGIQVAFLLHLDEFDRRRAFLDAGYDSLWAYCLGALHLREGPAGRRIGAMRVLRRFPALEGPLRDGRLCLSTVTLLGPLLSEENLSDVVERAAYRTKAEVEHLAATLQPRIAPRPGVRKLSGRADAPSRLTVAGAEPERAGISAPAPNAPSASAGSASQPPSGVESPCTPPPVAMPPQVPLDATQARRDGDSVELRPVSAEQWSLRVTIDARLKEDLETLSSLLSHTARGDLAAVLREAIGCGIEKHGKRIGSVKPARERRPAVALEAAATARPRAIPAAVRRAVWQRDEGCCTWTAPDGRRCSSRWKLELDHVHPAALGGTAAVENLRVLCRNHNVRHAEQDFGREHMARFRRAATLPGMSAGVAAT